MSNIQCSLRTLGSSPGSTQFMSRRMSNAIDKAVFDDECPVLLNPTGHGSNGIILDFWLAQLDCLLCSRSRERLNPYLSTKCRKYLNPGYF